MRHANQFSDKSGVLYFPKRLQPITAAAINVQNHSHTLSPLTTELLIGYLGSSVGTLLQLMHLTYMYFTFYSLPKARIEYFRRLRSRSDLPEILRYFWT
jgi:hypothetical protein